MTIDIYRDGIHATYNLSSNEGITRSCEEFTGIKPPYSTKIEFLPSAKYFTTTSVDIKQIEEKLLIAAANYSELRIVFRIDEENRVISGSESNLILNHIGGHIEDWIGIESVNDPESYIVKLAFDTEPPVSPKIFTTVNLSKVNDGKHINHVINTIKKYFGSYIGKPQINDNTRKYSFQISDILIGLRLYMNLNIKVILI